MSNEIENYTLGLLERQKIGKSESKEPLTNHEIPNLPFGKSWRRHDGI